jgi:hypothetical protein
MERQKVLRTTVGAGTALAVGVLVAMLIGSPSGQAQDDGGDSGRSLKGLAIAPVPLNLAGKDTELVNWAVISSTPWETATAATRTT